ncbi:MAG: hypothetical protein UHH95_02520, partial [Oscillospiraceae bacterium]|nr:hypothetical protein [Oscillospiraceae bacterium]
MATRGTSGKKKTSARRGRPTKAQAEAKRQSAIQSSRRQLWALVLFGASLILGVLTFLEGENFWSVLHRGFFGLFGIAAYLVAPLALLISVLLAFEQYIGSVKTKIFQALTLVMLMSGAFHIFFSVQPEGSNFFSRLINLFELGMERRGGGLCAALFGWSLVSLFGKVAASIVIVIVIIIFIFIVLGITVSDIVSFCKNTVKKPVEGLERAYQEHIEHRESEREDDDYSPDIDISLGPDAPKRTRRAPSTLTEEIDDPNAKTEKARRAKQKLLGADDIDIAVDDNEEQEQTPEVKIDDLFESETSTQEENTKTEEKKDEDEQTTLYSTGAENRIYTYPPLTLLNAPKITR